ncbi:MAG: tRNA lysidine(34) synthetase TilS [Acidobacteria bacterium]|nr:tRNA lysidine(34) synthetase TilS [Acidobacteriota bacterium]
MGKDHKIKLKTLMIRHKIPVSVRDTYPVIACLDGRVIWSPGLPASGFSAKTADEHAGRVVHLFAQEVTELTEEV